jgi:hypothetical protein
MKPSPTLFRQAILLLCSAAAWNVFSSNASAENRLALTECVGVKCNDFTTWNVPYVRQSVMITSDQLKSAVAVNSLPNHLEKIFREFSTSDPEAYAAAKKRLGDIQQHAESQAAEMGVPSPVMYVSGLKTQAAQTADGKDFILVNKDAFRLAVLSDDGAERMRVSLSREFAYIRNGDTSAAAVANHHNDPASSRQAGLRADLEGAGPLGTRSPIAATAAIQTDLTFELNRLSFAKDNLVSDLDPNRLSDRDYKQISDEHMRVTDEIYNLAPWDRIVALRKEARLMAEYERAHSVRTHADREAESKWLVDQIVPGATRSGQ